MIQLKIWFLYGHFYNFLSVCQYIIFGIKFIQKIDSGVNTNLAGQKLQRLHNFFYFEIQKFFNSAL